jgi:ABC-type hemin transport system ATPase subunit
MKLARLVLQAFGPFTGKVIDFAGHGTNLHLIYGPNEAGKSSALRAYCGRLHRPAGRTRGICAAQGPGADVVTF